ncbi:hypothetical protein [Candidatus Harpocratesius sp.]
MNRIDRKLIYILVFFALFIPNMKQDSLYFNSYPIKMHVDENLTSSLIKNQKNEISSLNQDFQWMTLTKSDISLFKNECGVYDPNINYPLQFKGYGTGALPRDEQDWDSLIGTQVIEGVYNKHKVDENLPDAIDHSTTPYFPAVGNQGMQPSCCSWAAGYYAYGFQEAKDNNWNAKSGDPHFLLSPAWIYNKIKMGSEGGSDYTSNFKILTSLGCPTMATMPYVVEDDVSWGTEAAFREAPFHRAKKAYHAFFRDAEQKIITIKSLLNNSILPVFYIDVAIYPDDCWENDFIVSIADLATGEGGHCQAFVGYNDSVEKDGELGAFKVVNSWGTEFGKDGFYWITYEAIINMLYEIYWVEDIPNYTPHLIATWTFKVAPTMFSSIKVGCGTPEKTYSKKSFEHYVYESTPLPKFMALDISELMEYYQTKSADFFIELSRPSVNNSILSSFFIEYYENTYSAGFPTRLSPQCSNMPLNIDMKLKTYAQSYLPGKPSPPTYVMYKNCSQSNNSNSYSNNDLLISWNYPLSTGYGNISKYRIYQIDLPANDINPFELNISETTVHFLKETFPIEPSKPTYAIISDSINFDNESILLTAVNEYGESIFSTPAVPFKPKIPNEPTNLKASKNNSIIQLSWKIPSDLGGGINISYNIYRGISPETIKKIGTTKNIETFDDLTAKNNNSKSFFYAVTAQNEAGESVLSEIIEVVNDLHISKITSYPLYIIGVIFVGYIAIKLSFLTKRRRIK